MTKKSISRGEEKEAVKTNKAILFSLWLVKVFPEGFLSLIIHIVSVFYFAAAKNARIEIRRFQENLQEYTAAKNAPISPKKISTFKTILSFAYCIIEKIAGWVGKIGHEKIITHNDSYSELIENLSEGKGALMFGAHMGNMELLRSLTSYNKTASKKNFSVLVILEHTSTEQFNKTIQKINPDFEMNAIESENITPDAIIRIQEHIENGGLVVLTGDRLPKDANGRTIKKTFLGKEADFPYGVYLVAALVKAPIYYIFGLRTKTAPLHPKYDLFIEKSAVDFTGEFSRKEREQKIDALCEEFVGVLERYSEQYPFQWYNFYNFWGEP